MKPNLSECLAEWKGARIRLAEANRDRTLWWDLSNAIKGKISLMELFLHHAGVITIVEEYAL